MAKKTFLLRIEERTLDDFARLANDVGMSANGLYDRIITDFLKLVSPMSPEQLKEVLNANE